LRGNIITPEFLKTRFPTIKEIFMNFINYNWRQIAEPYPLKIIGKPMNMEEARITFLQRFYELFEE
jgi:hypothetical protein